MYNTLGVAPQVELASTTYWEQLTCVGYNPEVSRLEAIVSIKQTSGYSGNLCSLGSTEYVRFFVDYHDGLGFQDAGLANFQVHDISEVEPGPQHPIEYMIDKSLDVTNHNKFISCDKAVIPTVRAILSWNTPPTSDPNFIPFYGNVLDANIQLKAFEPFILKLPHFHFLDAKVLKPIAEDIVEPAQPDLVKLAAAYEKAKVPQHRYTYSTISPLIANTQLSVNTVKFNADQIKLAKIDIAKIADLLADQNNFANVSFEELTCVGLNTTSDTVGAIVKIKLPNGYSGNLCETGSKEHVAFWADWNNDGVFEDYIGTASFEIHDISNMPADGIYYNVSLPLGSSKYRKDCLHSNVVRLRGVLSWETLPSTTDPDDLQYWGNRVDSLVQIKPGYGTDSLTLDIFKINEVPISQIDFTTGLAYRNTVVQNVNNNRPFGNEILIEGRFNNSGVAGTVHYKIQYSTNNGASWIDVTDIQRFQMYTQGIIGVTLIDDDPSLSNNWLTYREQNVFPVQTEGLGMLGIWHSGALNGRVLVRIAYTDEPYFVPFNPSTIYYSSPIAIYLDNTGFNVNPTPGNAINLAYTLDLALDGMDCAFVDATTDITGHLRVVDDYFSSWALDIFPSNHYHTGQSAATTLAPQNRPCNTIGDVGDAATPFTIETSNLDACGYALRLSATDRSLVGYRFYFIDGSYGFNLTSHYGEKYVGFAVLPS